MKKPHLNRQRRPNVAQRRPMFYIYIEFVCLLYKMYGKTYLKCADCILIRKCKRDIGFFWAFLP